MTIISLKTKLQKTLFGRCILKLYHYTVAIPFTYYYQLLYSLRKTSFKPIHFFSDAEVFRLLKYQRASLCRFGDGEIAWIYRDSKGYFGQENSEQLSVRLKEVLLSNRENLLVGVPRFFDSMNEYDSRRKKSRNVHLAKYGKKWMALLDENRIYADSLISRVYLGRNCDHQKMFDEWKSVWDKKNIIIVEGKDTKFGVGNSLLDNALSVRRILVPSENAFASYEKILSTVVKYDMNAIYLLAIGPTATVLAHDLAVLGYQAIDIGHLDIEFEWFVRKVQTKVAIEGKYVNETGGLSGATQLESQTEFEQQIIERCYE